MKTKIINQTGDWTFPWTKDLKEQAQNASDNYVVGEHLLLENDSMKIWSIHLPVGQSLPFHKHNKPYFYTIKNSGKSRSFYADGKVTETEYEKDDTKIFNNLSEENYFIHNLENIGDTTLVFTTVEFKKNQNNTKMKNTLFTPYDMNGISLENRFLMAPMTRSRASQPADIPNALMAEYYGQRASAGIIITEATQVSLQGKGYAKTPGIYTQEQIEGWKLITDEVHKKGSKIFLQLWHVGRVSSSKVNGLQPIAPSAKIAKETSVYIFDGAPNGDATFVPVEEPRAMTKEDIQQVINEFRIGAKNAIEAGFDGVEIHGANGYLIDQFLRSNSNVRTDEYGGSQENRVRILTEIAQAVADEVGTEKTGVRLSPFISFKDMNDPEILDTIMLAAQKLEEIGVTYIHLCEADWDDAPEIPNDFRVNLRKTFSKTIIATGNKTPKEGNELLGENLVDLVGFGRNFLTNPDYPKRVKTNADLNEISDTHTLFGGGTARGYTDYPFV